jgi:hypothetical protein
MNRRRLAISSSVTNPEARCLELQESNELVNKTGQELPETGGRCGVPAVAAGSDAGRVRRDGFCVQQEGAVFVNLTLSLDPPTITSFTPVQ